MYNGVGSIVLGYSAVALLGFRPGVNKSWDERNPICLEPGGAHVTSLGNSYGVKCW